MRGNGNTAASAKMILKVLQENFGTDVIHQAVIIKPDNFWHKQRSSIASNKYKFETTTISIQSLGKLVEPSQLTSDFEGFLHYDHAVWIDLRVAFEDFLWQASDILDRIDDLQEDLTHSECPEDVNGAKHSIDAHNEMKRKILKLPIEDLDLQGQKLLGKLTTYSNRNDDGCHSAPLPTNCINPDVTSAMNQVREESSGLLGDMGEDRVVQVSCVLRKVGVPLWENLVEIETHLSPQLVPILLSEAANQTDYGSGPQNRKLSVVWRGGRVAIIGSCEVTAPRATTV
uniref:CRAL-TRIO domain-containing protein n=1 Tax=Anopheles melas TaxID=34690 RepID=A0A182TK47_9DIPT